MIERLIAHSPKDRSAWLGEPLPRDVVDPLYAGSPAEDRERIATYLASLDWRTNRYLGKPDAMKADGFVGEPYRW